LGVLSFWPVLENDATTQLYPSSVVVGEYHKRKQLISSSTMADVVVTSPTSVRASVVAQEKNANRLLLSLDEMVQEIPAALTKRKLLKIEPGAPDDPVCHLFR
jgi:hypothetical protein